MLTLARRSGMATGGAQVGMFCVSDHPLAESNQLLLSAPAAASVERCRIKYCCPRVTARARRRRQQIKTTRPRKRAAAIVAVRAAIRVARCADESFVATVACDVT